MNLKFELVMTVWEDGIFKIIDKIEASDSHSLREQFEMAMDKVEDRLKPVTQEIDDDIPS